MPFELILPPDTQTDIRSYLEARFDSVETRLLAWDEIERELLKLARNPSLGVPPLGGPFEKRPIYRFSIEVGGVKYYTQVVYKVHARDRLVVLLGFSGLRL